jgi:uncharacterized protein YacL
LWDKIPENFKTISFAIASILFIFCSIYFGAWFANGYWGTHFELAALLNLLKSIGDFIGLIVAKFGIDSLLNTEIPWLKDIVNKFKGSAVNGTCNTERHSDNG